MENKRLSSLEQAAVCLRDCGVVSARGKARIRFDMLVRLGLAERHADRFRLTPHGAASLVAAGLA